MLRKRWLMGLALLLVLAQVPPATAQERSPLSLVPDKAPLVMGIRGYKGLTDRAMKMVTNALPDLAPKLKDLIDEGMKKGFEGREAMLKGLAPDAPIIMIFMEMPKPNAEPNAAVLIGVKDFNAFREGLFKKGEVEDVKKLKGGIESATVEGKTVYLANLKDYALVTTTEETARLLTQKNIKGLDKKLSPETAKKVLSSDFAVYLNMGPLLEEHAEKIREAQDQVKDGFAQVENLGKLDKAQIKLAQTLVDALFRAVQDSRSLVFAASFEPQGLALHYEVALAKGSVSAKFLKDAKLSPLAGLTRLPRGFLSYTGLDFDAKMSKQLQPLMQGIFAESDSDAGKAVSKALDQIAAAGPKGTVMASAVPQRGVTVTEFEDASKALAAQLQMIQAVAKGEQFAFMPLKDGIKIQRKAESYRGAEWARVSMKFDLDKMFGDIPGGAEAFIQGMKKLTGEGVTMWLGAVDNKVIAVTAKDWKVAQKLLDQYLDQKNDMSGDKGFQLVREHLPRETSMVQIINMSKYLDVLTTMVAPLMEQFGKNVEIPPSKAKNASYVGFAATFQPQRIGVDIFISGGSAREVYRVVDPFIKAFGGGGF